MRRWDDALRVLEPIPDLVEKEAEVEGRVDRTRLVHCLLRLGQTAANLASYDDAAKHYIRCIKVLHDKKLDLPLEQVKARIGLALTQIMRGLYSSAVQYYKEAISYSLYVDDDDERGHIYYGLAYLYERMGNLIEARLAALEALKLYKRGTSDFSQHMVGTTHNLLGKTTLLLGDYREASDHYTYALALAPQFSGPKMCMLNCTGLAEVRIAEKRFEEADNYCRMALKYVQEIKEKDEQLFGLTYLSFGKVAQAKAENAEGGCKTQVLEEAIEWFGKAEEKLASTQAHADIAELYVRWAAVLEELGKERDAIRYWKSGYEALAATNVPMWE